MNANSNVGGLPGTGFLTGTGVVNQLVYALLLVLIIHIVFFAAEKIYKTFVAYDKAVTELLPLTYASDKDYTVSQNPNERGSNSISLSDNERTGVEFSYSFYIYVNPTTFGGSGDLKHVFHKGYPKQYPLLGPGVYMMGSQNTMRIYMNSTTNWNSYVDIDNFPVQKWVHVGLICRAGGLEVYINGDLKNRLNFSGGVPYQNFQDIFAFASGNYQLPVAAVSGSATYLNIAGAFSGLLSRLRYFNYALGYTELAQLVNEGPNKRMATSEQGDKPPYLIDTWWTTRL